MWSVNGTENILPGTGNFVLQSDALPRKVKPMNRTEAEEHLRVIRSLMEKATIYRAISAPTALVGGMLAVIVGFAFVWPLRVLAKSPAAFFIAWLAVLAVTAAANAFFIRRDARRRGDAFISPGMKMALTALAPSHITAGFVTALAAWAVLHFYILLPGFWCVLYGLGLLAMSHFAPRSIVRLGWSFLIAGLIVTGIVFEGFGSILPEGVSLVQISNAVMALTFGIFHLIYAACTWPRAGRPENAAGE